MYRFWAIRELQRVSNCAHKRAMHIQSVFKKGGWTGPHLICLYDVNFKKTIGAGITSRKAFRANPKYLP